jgi:acyl carrier protein
MRLRDEDSLLELRIVDSTGFLEVMHFIESTFGITVGDNEMIPENLETIENITGFVTRKLSGA